MHHWPRPSDRQSQSGSNSASSPITTMNMNAFTTALTNPYAHLYPQHNLSPHYYQAYMQASSSMAPATTAEGYTLSSTYVSGRQTNQPPRPHLPDSNPPTRPPAQPITEKKPRDPLTYGSWYQPGNSRCMRQGCPFVGSHKSVEIHMMDRHLIFPPGWEKRKKDEWDADPSLRGKPIAIQGTSLVLDTEEAIDAWIAERKTRYPTAQRIEDKKRKLDEAVARGQLGPEDMGIGARKRRQHANVVGRHPRGLVQRGRGRGALRGRERFVRRDISQEGLKDTCTIQSPVTPAGGVHCSSGSESDANESPEVVSSKIPVGQTEPSSKRDSAIPSPLVTPRRTHPPQPKKMPRNPFASRPTLLRNLLLPEIRITVSNLSQAIRFLVDNEFLRDVELRPGEEKMIQVIKNTETNASVSAVDTLHTKEE